MAWCFELIFVCSYAVYEQHIYLNPPRVWHFCAPQKISTKNWTKRGLRLDTLNGGSVWKLKPMLFVWFHSLRIHVWYIHLHLVDFYGKCSEIYHTWILWNCKCHSHLRLAPHQRVASTLKLWTLFPECHTSPDVLPSEQRHITSRWIQIKQKVAGKNKLHPLRLT